MKEKEKKLIYSPAIMNKLRECIRGRAGKAEELFKTELFNVAQSIAENEDSLIIGPNLIYSNAFPYIIMTLSQKPQSAIQK